ncbi:MAG: hypothetical protein BEN18_00425 [Epulopiscium sp. Nuni2H_MBin001]|nr:MAG: hypothetical protein BEN18_00425 [Epulopiscium sp. Nuni2H_MBin001]
MQKIGIRPKVSIIIPLYNSELYIEECLDSIINQSLKEIEIICVDDASTDRTLNIVKNYALKDNRIIIIENEKNLGTGGATNRGIYIATGEYIGAVDADDYVDLDMYKDLYNLAKINNLVVIKGNYYTFIHENGKRIFTFHKSAKEDFHYDRVFFPLMEPNMQYFSYHWAGIYATDYIRKYNITWNEDEKSRFQDAGFCFKVLIHGGNMMFVNKPYYMWRRDNPNSQTVIKTKEYALGICEEYKYIRAYLHKFPREEIVLKTFFYNRMFNSYMWKYKCNTDEVNKIFLTRWAQDFKNAIDNDGLNKECFDEWTWRRILYLTTYSADVSKKIVSIAKLADILKKSKVEGYYIYTFNGEGKEIYDNLIAYNISKSLLGFIKENVDKYKEESMYYDYPSCKKDNVLFIVKAYHLEFITILDHDKMNYVVMM